MDNQTDGSKQGRKLAFMRYANEFDNTGVRRAGTWEQIKGLLIADHKIRAEKSGSPAFSPGFLKTGTTRSSTNVEMVSLAVADVDGTIAFDELKARIAQYEWAAHSSHGHTPPELNKYRVVFPMSRECSTEEWPQVWEGFNVLLGGCLDKNCKDPSRLYFLPCCPTDRKALAFTDYNTGDFVDVEYMKSIAPIQQLANRKDWSAFGMSVGNDMASIDYPKSYLKNIVAHCQQVKHFSETGGGTEPEWYSNLGLAKHCEDGEHLAYEWSAKYSGYSAKETSRKLEQWAYGPTTCAKFAEANETLCKGCKHAGEISSPIQLGFAMEEKPPVISVAASTPSAGDIQEQPETVPLTPEHWPQSASVRNGKMYYTIEVEGVAKPVLFASPMFWPVGRIRTEDGTYCYHMAMVVKDGAPLRYFDLPTKSMVDGRSLRMALASYECIVYNDKLAVRFMSEYSAMMRQLKEETQVYSQMGWSGDDFTEFLIGDRMITKSSVNKVRLSEKAFKDDQIKNAFVQSKNAEHWIKGVDTLYNVPNGQPYQYVICTAFGSPLVSMMNYDDWNGIPLAVTTGNTSYGKTTVSKIAINAISSGPKTTIATTTALAISSRASAMGSLIVLFDELSDKGPMEVRDILYSLSNGRPKIGMLSDGTERKVGLRWKLNSIITGNRNFFFKLTEASDNPEAPQMRVFEIDLMNYPPLPSFAQETDNDTKVKHKELATDLVNNTSCVFSVEYLRFIMKNKDEIKEKLHSLSASISRSLGNAGQKERFYVYHMACTIVGGVIAKKLGYINFDMKALKEWAIKHILSMRDMAEQSRATPRDLLSEMLADFHGHFLVTRRFETLNSSSGILEAPMFQVKTPVVGRIVLGDGKLEFPRIFITSSSIGKWCKDNGHSPFVIRRAMEDGNLLVGGAYREGGKRRRDKEVSIGRGISGVSLGCPRCVELSYAAAQGYIEDIAKIDNVVEFPAKPGQSEVTAEVSGG